THPKVVVEMPRFEIVVVALQSLHGTARPIVREAHQQVRERVPGIRALEAPVADAVLPDMKTIVAVQPFHAGLHLMPSVDKADRTEKLEMPDPNILGPLVGWRPLEALIARDPDCGPALFRTHRSIFEPL